ncbi:MAG: hypothetical protein JNL73_01195 [Anaerolineales bacterium]|nr:hypothetical protein [Anaerolineales bacterium]
MLKRFSSDQRIAALLFVLLSVAYAYVFPRWADPNQDSRLKMVVALVDDGTFQIDKYLGTTVDYARVGDHYYSDKAPGVAFLGVPVYWTLRQLPIFDALSERLASSSAFQGTLREGGGGVSADRVRFAVAQVAIALVVGALPTALLAALIFLWLSRVTPAVGPRLVVALAYALLTPAFAYANTMYGHQLAGLLLFGSFFWLSTSQRLSWPALAAIGGLLAYTVVTEYPMALVVGVLYVYAAWKLWRAGRLAGLIPLTAVAAVIALAWMSYNNAIFGGPLNLGYSYSEQWVKQHETGFMSLTLPRGEALWGITFGVFRGLFVLAPWLLLSLPGLGLWWASERRPGAGRVEWGVVVAAVVLIVLFNASSVMWWGGFAIGPRYVLPALPFLALSVGYVLAIWGRTLWLRIGLALLLAWSWVATWGLSLAEQAFPSDAIRNPLIEYAWPNWLAGNIARNAGTLLGLRGPLGLLPLILLLAIGIGLLVWLGRSTASATPASTTHSV